MRAHPFARPIDKLPRHPDGLCGIDPGQPPSQRDKAVQWEACFPRVKASVQQLAAIMLTKLPANLVRSIARATTLQSDWRQGNHPYNRQINSQFAKPMFFQRKF